MEINFTAQLTAQDYADAQRLHSGFRAHVIVGILMVVVISTVVVTSENARNFQTWSVAGCIWLIWLLIFFVMQPRGMAKRAAKIFAQQKDLQRPHEIEIKDDQIVTRSAGRGEWKTPWDDFHKWKGNRKLVLVYRSDRLFHMFPRRWFGSHDEFQSFKDLLTRTIGPAGKAKKRT